MSHLMFADDLLFLAKESMDQVEVIKNSLASFEKSFGQKVKFFKTRIYFSPNVVGMDDVLSQATGMTRTKDLGKYLGARLVHRRCNKEMFEELLTRFNNKLSGWKAKCLSFAGRVTLARSVMGSLPT